MFARKRLVAGGIVLDDQPFIARRLFWILRSAPARWGG